MPYLKLKVLIAASIMVLAPIGARPVGLEPGTDLKVITLAKSSAKEKVLLCGNTPTNIPFDVSPRELVDQARTLPDGYRIFLALEEIRADAPPGFRYEVFVATRDDSSISDENFVGHLNIFDLVQREVAFDVTETVNALARNVGEAELVVIIQPPVDTSARNKQAAGPPNTLCPHITLAGARFVAE